MALKSRITEEMKAAMRARETARLSTIRLLLAAIKQREVDERIELVDADIVNIIDRMIKQRRESIAAFISSVMRLLSAISSRPRKRGESLRPLVYGPVRPAPSNRVWAATAGCAAACSAA